MCFCKVHVVLLLLWLVLTAAAAAQGDGTGYQVLADPLPPFNFEQGGEIHGVTVDVLHEIAATVGMELESVHMMPWARALHEAENGRRRIVISVARTPEREQGFKWVGPICTVRIGLVGKRGKLVHFANAVQAGQFKVCAVRGSAPLNLLVEKGYPEGMLTQVASSRQCLEMLGYDRVDYFTHVDLPAAHLMAAEGMDPAQYGMALTLRTVDLYIAFSPDIDDTLISRLNTALEHLKKNNGGSTSRFARIMDSYLDSGRLFHE